MIVSGLEKIKWQKGELLRAFPDDERHENVMLSDKPEEVRYTAQQLRHGDDADSRRDDNSMQAAGERAHPLLSAPGATIRLFCFSRSMAREW